MIGKEIKIVRKFDALAPNALYTLLHFVNIMKLKRTTNKCFRPIKPKDPHKV